MADVSQIKLPNGSVYDLIDEKSGYITAEYIENKTDYEIPVSRVGEIVVGETAIGTDSTNFPTSKAVVDYVDERVVQEMDAIDVGVTGIKANGTSLAIENGVVNIPGVNMQTGQAGLVTSEFVDSFKNYVRSVRDSIPTSTSQLTNDSGFITTSDIPAETDPTVPAWAKASTKPTYTASEVGALPSDTVITDEKLRVNQTSDNGTYYPILTSNSTEAQTKLRYYGLNFVIASSGAQLRIGDTSLSAPKMGKLTLTKHTFYTTIEPSNNGHSNTITLPNKTGTVALLDDIPTVPTNISSFTNDSGYLTASDIASVMIYKGTKANYAALPSSGNTTGDVWHLTDTGAEWAWDGSAWQELGTAIDLSGYATKATTLAGYGITDAKIQNGTITLGSNTITPLTSFTETDPVFSASAAAGITSTDISNWNSKVSDDKTWNSVTLNKSLMTTNQSIYIPYLSTNTATEAKLVEVIEGTTTAHKIPKYDNNAYLYSTTPSANDNSTKVATTAYVDAAIPDVSGYVSKSGDTMTGRLTLNYNSQINNRGLVFNFNDNYKVLIDCGGGNYSGSDAIARLSFSTVGTTNGVRLRGIATPDTDDSAANKQYVDNSIPKVYSSTNTGGYLTMATLPIYDGTVE